MSKKIREKKAEKRKEGSLHLSFISWSSLKKCMRRGNGSWKYMTSQDPYFECYCYTQCDVSLATWGLHLHNWKSYFISCLRWGRCLETFISRFLWVDWESTKSISSILSNLIYVFLSWDFLHLYFISQSLWTPTSAMRQINQLLRYKNCNNPRRIFMSSPEAVRCKSCVHIWLNYFLYWRHPRDFG